MQLLLKQMQLILKQIFTFLQKFIINKLYYGFLFLFFLMLIYIGYSKLTITQSIVIISFVLIFNISIFILRKKIKPSNKFLFRIIDKNYVLIFKKFLEIKWFFFNLYIITLGNFMLCVSEINKLTHANLELLGTHVGLQAHTTTNILEIVGLFTIFFGGLYGITYAYKYYNGTIPPINPKFEEKSTTNIKFEEKSTTNIKFEEKSTINTKFEEKSPTNAEFEDKLDTIIYNVSLLQKKSIAIQKKLVVISEGEEKYTKDITDLVGVAHDSIQDSIKDLNKTIEFQTVLTSTTICNKQAENIYQNIQNLQKNLNENYKNVSTQNELPQSVKNDLMNLIKQLDEINANLLRKAKFESIPNNLVGNLHIPKFRFGELSDLESDIKISKWLVELGNEFLLTSIGISGLDFFFKLCHHFFGTTLLSIPKPVISIFPTKT